MLILKNVERSMTRSTLFTIAILMFASSVFGLINHDKIVSCYYSSWAYYRPGDGQFAPSDIDPQICTDIFYGFADLVNDTHNDGTNKEAWKVDILDPWFDLLSTDVDCGLIYTDPSGQCFHGGYRAFTKHKDDNANLRAFLSIGGWNAGSGDYSQMANVRTRRTTFITDCIRIAQEYDFDGIDLDWEYPGSRAGANCSGTCNDIENFSALIEDMYTALKTEELMFTSAVAAGYDKIAMGYNIPDLNLYFDYVHLMGYDFAGGWNNFSAHNAGLFRRPEENDVEHPQWKYNLYDGVMEWLNGGLLPEKLVVGMPTYGRGYEMSVADESRIYCQADRPNPAGPYTRQRGHFGYNEIVQLFHNNTLPNLPLATPLAWQVHVDDCYKAPHVVNNVYWISYDDPDSIKEKTEFVKAIGAKGAMVWSIETDDFKGVDGEVYPIINAINEVFHSNSPGKNPACTPCTPSSACTLWGNTYDTTLPPTPAVCTATTTTTVTTTTTTTSTTTTTPSGPVTVNDCTSNGQYLSYPDNCNLYYRCYEVQGVMELHCYNCQGENIWTGSKCDPPGGNTCGSGKSQCCPGVVCGE